MQLSWEDARQVSSAASEIRITQSGRNLTPLECESWETGNTTTLVLNLVGMRRTVDQRNKNKEETLHCIILEFFFSEILLDS